ncbi:heme o synthase [Brachybacterium sp. GPGPB12]|uniref:heme o synthase n=1 Tax=Brachybacterium sp. GPGPB12 TaxID=3023517 RepID=UPI0031343DE8
MTATQGAQARGAGQDGGSGPRTVGSTLRAYVALTKPRIIESLLITTIPTMFLAAGGFPSLWLIIATMVGGYLAAGGANALNMYLERDIDAKMKRTRKRPIPSGAVTPRAALIFGLTISAVSALWLGLLVNWVSAALAVGAILLYVVFYTMILKRRTSQNIVWGGIAGRMPVLIGWSAVTGTVSWTAVFAVPGDLLLDAAALLAAGREVPGRLRQGGRADARRWCPLARTSRARCSLHTALMIASSLAIIPLGETGWVYGVAAVASGAWFGFLVVRYALRVRQGLSGRALAPMKVFHGSITYLTVLFVALAIDPFVTL